MANPAPHLTGAADELVLMRSPIAAPAGEL